MTNLKNLSKVLAVLLLGTLLIFAANQTEKFEVKGACGMCETRIENTAKSIKGVKTADWTLENNILELKFNDKKTSLREVQAALAAVGHDNGNFRAPDGVYENLPACCHYERDDAKKAGDCASGNCSEEKSAKTHKMAAEEESSCSGACSEEEKSACESGSCEEPEK